MTQINVLDHGFVRFIEAWGHGDAGPNTTESLLNNTQDMECGIIEAARQSTQASFRGWEDKVCSTCHGTKQERRLVSDDDGNVADSYLADCSECDGKGYIPGDARLLKYLFCNKPPHATPFEFAGMVIEVQAPIFCFREWHRHRTQSYNEMSARYAPLPDLNYLPTVERCLMNSTQNKQAGRIKGADDLDEQGARDFIDLLRVDYEVAETHYQQWLKAGVPKELARVVLPVGRYSRMRASANLRNWLAFMTLRSDPGAQYEIRMYAEAIGTIIADKFPRTWALYKG